MSERLTDEQVAEALGQAKEYAEREYLVGEYHALVARALLQVSADLSAAKEREAEMSRARLEMLRVRLANIEPCLRHSRTHAERLAYSTFVDFLRAEIRMAEHAIRAMPIPEPSR